MSCFYIQCSRGTSLDAFFKDFQSEPTKIALVGCGCSVATEPVAEISHRWNISQVYSVLRFYGCKCSHKHTHTYTCAHAHTHTYTHIHNMQLSIASAVSSLGDRTRFKNIFRTYPTFKNFAPAVLSIMNHYGWRRAAFLSENLNLFNKVSSPIKNTFVYIIIITLTCGTVII